MAPNVDKPAIFERIRAIHGAVFENHELDRDLPVVRAIRGLRYDFCLSRVVIDQLEPLIRAR